MQKIPPLCHLRTHVVCSRRGMMPYRGGGDHCSKCSSRSYGYSIAPNFAAAKNDIQLTVWYETLYRCKDYNYWIQYILVDRHSENYYIKSPLERIPDLILDSDYIISSRFLLRRIFVHYIKCQVRFLFPVRFNHL